MLRDPYDRDLPSGVLKLYFLSKICKYTVIVLVLTLALVATVAFADDGPALVFQHEKGDRVVLLTTACDGGTALEILHATLSKRLQDMGTLQRAVYQHRNGNNIPGCWALFDGGVNIVTAWTDGDMFIHDRNIFSIGPAARPPVKGSCSAAQVGCT